MRRQAFCGLRPPISSYGSSCVPRKACRRTGCRRNLGNGLYPRSIQSLSCRGICFHVLCLVILFFRHFRHSGVLAPPTTPVSSGSQTDTGPRLFQLLSRWRSFLYARHCLKIPHLLSILFVTHGGHLLLRLFPVSLLHLNFLNILAYYVDVGFINHSRKGSYQCLTAMSTDGRTVQLPYQITSGLVSPCEINLTIER